MGKEIEVKAHIPNDMLKSLREIIEKRFGKGKEEIKRDEYFKDKDNRTFRVRKENDKLIYTKKEQSLENNIEINNETEYTISEKEYNDITTKYTPFFKKNKIGTIWSCTLNGFCSNIEIVEVSGYYIDNTSIKVDTKNLGFFLETEILIDENEYKSNPNLKEEAKNTLLNFYKKLNLQKNIEYKKYMEMIQF